MQPFRSLDRSGNNQIISVYYNNSRNTNTSNTSRKTAPSNNHLSTEVDDNVLMVKVLKERLHRATKNGNLSRQIETQPHRKLRQKQHRHGHKNFRISGDQEQLNDITTSNVGSKPKRGDFPIPPKNVRLRDRTKHLCTLYRINNDKSDIELQNLGKITIIGKFYSPKTTENLNTARIDNDIIIKCNNLGKNINYKPTQEEPVLDDCVKNEEKKPDKETSEGTVYLDDNTVVDDDPVVEGKTVVEKNPDVRNEPVRRRGRFEFSDRCQIGTFCVVFWVVGITIIVLGLLGITKGKGNFNSDGHDSPSNVGGPGGGGGGGGG